MFSKNPKKPMGSKMESQMSAMSKMAKKAPKKAMKPQGKVLPEVRSMKGKY